MKTILIVEDDTNIREGLSDAIEADGHRPLLAADGEEAVEQFFAKGPDLVLLDIMMPKKNGYDVCRQIREKNKQVPILMLTAKTEEIDHVLGLELGADDYIEKPFRVRELLARIHAALRRVDAFSSTTATAKKATSHTFEFGPVTIDPRRLVAIVDDEEKELTERELTLLHLFHAHPQEALSRDFLLDEAWGIDYQGTTRTLDQHIAKLRAKIEPSDSPSLIKTVHGVGYKFSG
ncbi:response regulator transcription factor [Pelagicoccus sp. SDUM812003]|uniref:response regulator transcription factor n=1 Tax=Pelagicoccus sp. SDUM812003 TaxID=3041267 RepID=UPI00280D804E|nr:response regulator transcription factor [Pelagicoccus sp. SDUM812003]MDQ8203564.1 response regulator transcription factor [Pelagicoccus sp. SDUM812003]